MNEPKARLSAVAEWCKDMRVVLWQIANVLPRVLWGKKMGVSLPIRHMTLNTRELC